MTLSDRLIKKATALILLTTILFLMLPTLVSAQATARAGLLNAMEIRPGVEVEIPIEIERVVDLYGIEIELKFDPAFWEFRDADPRREGIQPAIGTFLDPGMTLFNIIDPQTGRIHLVMSQVNPSVGKSGKGNIMVLYATPLKTGVTQIEVSKVELSTRDGVAIEVEGVNGEVTIKSEAPQVTATSIPVVDPTQIIIIPTFAPPTATPRILPTSTPRPTATAPTVETPMASTADNTKAVSEGEVKETSQPGGDKTEAASEGELKETTQPGGASTNTASGQGSALSKEGENHGNAGIWIGVSVLAVVLAAVGFYLHNKTKSSTTREE